MEILSKLPEIINSLSNQGFNLKINGCVHIGAHNGQEYPLYKHFGIINLLFYEPLDANFEQLKTRVQFDPFCEIRKKALGNTVGTIEMFLEDRGLSSSVLAPKYHLQQYPQIKFDTKTTVEITKLDNEEFDRSKFNFMNIDVQGYELEVLKGSEKTLENIDLILTEINKEEMYENCALVDDIDSYLEKFSFKRIFTYWQLDGGTWGDALYLKVK